MLFCKLQYKILMIHVIYLCYDDMIRRIYNRIVSIIFLSILSIFYFFFFLDSNIGTHRCHKIIIIPVRSESLKKKKRNYCNLSFTQPYLNLLTSISYICRFWRGTTRIAVNSGILRRKLWKCYRCMIREQKHYAVRKIHQSRVASITSRIHVYSVTRNTFFPKTMQLLAKLTFQENVLVQTMNCFLRIT